MNNLYFLVCLFFSPIIFATELKVGDKAPVFLAQVQDGTTFNLQNQVGKWTVLYFYPKADTPGCTKQACAFRDSIKKITDLGAEVYGVSVNNIKDQAAFHKKHALKFSLIADEKAEIVKLYGTKMPFLNISKRWTFVLDDQLKIRKIEKDVDPLLDAEKVAEFIQSEKNKEKK